MLNRHVRKKLRQMIRQNQIVSVRRVRTDNIRGKFRGKFVVQIVIPLIFREIFGVMQFTHVVV